LAADPLEERSFNFFPREFHRSALIITNLANSTSSDKFRLFALRPKNINGTNGHTAAAEGAKVWSNYSRK